MFIEAHELSANMGALHACPTGSMALWVDEGDTARWLMVATPTPVGRNLESRPLFQFPRLPLDRADGHNAAL